jgi:Heavy metal associated domain 2
VAWSESATDTPRTLRVVHDIPGRLRLRLPRGVGAAGLSDVIDRLPGAQSSVWSPRTGSLLIRYDPDVLNAAAITQAVAEHADLVRPAPDDLPGATATAGRAPVARAIVETFSDINGRVAHRTRGRLDLGILIPVALVLWAGRQLLRSPITSLSWTSALWYAHGLFRDYHASSREP